MANLKDINYGIGKYLEASDASGIPDIGTNRKNLDLLNFKVATNNAYSLYNFKDGMIDAYQTQDGVDASGSTNDSYDSTDKVYSPSVFAEATGGTKTVVGSFTYHLFTSNGNFVVPGSGTVEALIVAGGGGGGENVGGGGGAGGVVHDTALAVTAQTYAMVIGSGGAGKHMSGQAGDSGTDTTGFGWTAKGGGGGHIFQNNTGLTGGSGGAGGGYSGAGGATNQASSGTGSSGTRTAYGFAGEASNSGSSNGGGAGGTNGNALYVANFDAGSLGGANYSGAPVTSPYGYFGGGGGSGKTSGDQPGGGAGAGNGAVGGANQPGAPATGTWGSGGGGGAENNAAGRPGASGSVVIRYNQSTNGWGQTNNMTLISNAQTAQAAPTEGRLMLYEEDIDSITLNTDIKGYVSRDGGTTYTQTPLTDEGYINTYRGIDSYTKLMLHCDGANGGTTFTDSSFSAHAVTRNSGTTQTGIKKFGTASCYQDGTGTDTIGQLSIANSSDWDFGTGAFTVDFWLYLFTLGSNLNQKIIGCSDYSGGWKGWHLKKDHSLMKLNWEGGANTTAFNTASSSALTAETWTHIAIAKSGTTTKLFFNGVEQFSLTQNYAIQSTGAETLQIGEGGADANWNLPKMYIDEIRISKGIARWTSAFTPPSLPYNIADRILSGSVDISGQPSGTDMKYKVETLNNKNLRLHGASLLWA